MKKGVTGNPREGGTVDFRTRVDRKENPEEKVVQEDFGRIITTRISVKVSNREFYFTSGWPKRRKEEEPTLEKGEDVETG